MSDWLETIAVLDQDYFTLGEISLPQHVIEHGQKKGHVLLCNPSGAGNFPPKFIFLLRKNKGRMVLIAPENFHKTPVHQLPQRFVPKVHG